MSILDDNTAVPPPEPYLPEPALPVLPPVTVIAPFPSPTSTVAQPAFSLPAARPAMVRRRRRKRRGLRALVTLVVLGALGGGSYVMYDELLEPDADSPATPDVATGMSLAGAEAMSTTLGATVLPVDVQAETDRLFEACKEYIPTGAFAGDPIAAEMWNQLDQDPARLPMTCSELLYDDRVLAQHMATEMEKIRAEIALHTTTTGAPPATAPGPVTSIVNLPPFELPPTPPRTAPANTCYIMDTDGDGVTDQCVPWNMVD
jgi:hypothetical protein